MSRPSTLGPTRFLGFRATRQDQQHIARLVRVSAGYNVDVNKTQVMRDALGIAASHLAAQEFDSLQRLQAELQETRRRMEAAERSIDRERKLRARAEKHVRRKKSQIEALIRHLPDVRRRAQHRLEYPSGVDALDALWTRCGRSWKRVQHRLEEVQRQLQADDAGEPPPPDPGGGGR